MPTDLSTLTFSTTEEWRELEKIQPGLFVLEFAIGPEGKHYLRVKGRDAVYVQNKEFLQCAQCGSDILTAEIYHPIWNNGVAGDGKCRIEEVPYCPKCEEKPNYSGMPIIRD